MDRPAPCVNATEEQDVEIVTVIGSTRDESDCVRARASSNVEGRLFPAPYAPPLRLQAADQVLTVNTVVGAEPEWVTMSSPLRLLGR